MASFPFPIPGMPIPPGMPGGFPVPFFPQMALGTGLFPPPPGHSVSTQSAPVEEEVAPPDDVEPNETLYVNNLNNRITEKNIKPFLQKVYHLFSPIPNAFLALFAIRKM